MPPGQELFCFAFSLIDSGTYIERIFPLLHVRYIAVNDDFDTDREGTDLAMPLKNIINEWYARDISDKIHTSYQAMWKDGQYIYGRPTYGYKKDAVAKKLVVDGETFFLGKCVCVCCRKNIGVVRSNIRSSFFYYQCTTFRQAVNKIRENFVKAVITKSKIKRNKLFMKIYKQLKKSLYQYI